MATTLTGRADARGCWRRPRLHRRGRVSCLAGPGAVRSAELAWRSRSAPEHVPIAWCWNASIPGTAAAVASGRQEGGRRCRCEPPVLGSRALHHAHTPSLIYARSVKAGRKWTPVSPVENGPGNATETDAGDAGRHRGDLARALSDPSRASWPGGGCRARRLAGTPSRRRWRRPSAPEHRSVQRPVGWGKSVTRRGCIRG
jgi:hypothetical protein